MLIFHVMYTCPIYIAGFLGVRIVSALISTLQLKHDFNTDKGTTVTQVMTTIIPRYRHLSSDYNIKEPAVEPALLIHLLIAHLLTDISGMFKKSCLQCQRDCEPLNKQTKKKQGRR